MMRAQDHLQLLLMKRTLQARCKFRLWLKRKKNCSRRPELLSKKTKHSRILCKLVRIFWMPNHRFLLIKKEDSTRDSCLSLLSLSNKERKKPSGTKEIQQWPAQRLLSHRPTKDQEIKTKDQQALKSIKVVESIQIMRQNLTKEIKTIR